MNIGDRIYCEHLDEISGIVFDIQPADKLLHIQQYNTNTTWDKIWPNWKQQKIIYVRFHIPIKPASIDYLVKYIYNTYDEAQEKYLKAETRLEWSVPEASLITESEYECWRYRHY